jgi:hypothetical protein
MISDRAVRVPRTRSEYPLCLGFSWSRILWTPASSVQPQNKFSRLTKTVDLNNPISDSANGCGTQLFAGSLGFLFFTVAVFPMNRKFSKSLNQTEFKHILLPSVSMDCYRLSPMFRDAPEQNVTDFCYRPAVFGNPQIASR